MARTTVGGNLKERVGAVTRRVDKLGGARSRAEQINKQAPSQRPTRAPAPRPTDRVNAVRRLSGPEGRQELEGRGVNVPGLIEKRLEAPNLDRVKNAFRMAGEQLRAGRDGGQLPRIGLPEQPFQPAPQIAPQPAPTAQPAPQAAPQAAPAPVAPPPPQFQGFIPNPNVAPPPGTVNPPMQPVAPVQPPAPQSFGPAQGGRLGGGQMGNFMNVLQQLLQRLQGGRNAPTGRPF